MLTSEQIRAARALLRWGQEKLAEASQVSVETVKRLERQDGPVSAHTKTEAGLRSAFETAGVEFIDANGGGPGVRLRDR